MWKIYEAEIRSAGGKESMNKNKSFFSYVIPSVIAFALSGVYAIADGFFIGNSLGDIGLSAINIAYPIGAFMQAVGTGIGMGGAVNYSIYSASGDKEKADSYAGGTGTILLIASVVLTAFLYIGLEPILILLGAEGDLLAFSKDYLRIIVLGAVFQIFSTGIVPLIRNYNGAAFAMASMTAGFSTNILLDYIFVWVLKWGVSGAAIATIIGQSVTMITGLAYLLVKKRPVFCFGITKVGSMFLQIVKVGLAPFGLTVTPNLSVILMNRYTIFYGGEQAVASYACIAYALTIVYMLLQGVGDGSQPLMSRCYGEGAVKELYGVRHLAYVYAEIFAIFSILILFLGRFHIGKLFGASEYVLAETGNVLPVFLAGIIFLAFTRVTTSVFYATEKSLFSYILVYIEPVLLFIFLLVLSYFRGISGVWWSTCLSQVVCAMIALYLKYKSDT